MPNSYLPSGVYVNCTFMTVTTPQHLGVNRNRINALIKGREATLLNIEDKKISDSFACKNPAKFWLGLAYLCLGIAIGIFLTAAVIGTGGAALVAILAVVAAALTTSAVSIGVGLYKQAHDCDCTLKSQWISPHDSVEIDGAKALLQRSFLQCTNGGIVQPFISSAIAANAAVVFAHNNNAEITDQVVSQFAIGIVSMVSTLGDPVGAVLGSTLSVYSYVDGYDVNEEKGFINDLSSVGKDTARDNLIGITPSTVVAIKEVTKMNLAMVPELMNQGVSFAMANRLKDAFGFGMGEVGKKVGKSIGAGLVGVLINFGIQQWAKKYKREHIEKVKKERLRAKEEDSKNGIDILAKQ